MKNTKTITLLTAALLLMACASDEEKIEKAAYKYNYAMANYDVDGAERYATQETRETTLETARELLPMVNPDYIKSDTPATIEIGNIAMANDTLAYVNYRKRTPIKDMTLSIEMRKRHGRWLAHAPIPVMEMPEAPMPTDDKGEEE